LSARPFSSLLAAAAIRCGRGAVLLLALAGRSYLLLLGPGAHIWDAATTSGTEGLDALAATALPPERDAVRLTDAEERAWAELVRDLAPRPHRLT
jgi:hypothetical protein